MNACANRPEHGYALVDVLVGLALGGILLLLASTGFTHLSLVRQRTSEAADRHREIALLATTLRRLVENRTPVSAAMLEALPEPSAQRLEVPMAGTDSEDDRGFNLVTLDVRSLPSGKAYLALSDAGRKSGGAEVLFGPVDRLSFLHNLASVPGGDTPPKVGRGTAHDIVRVEAEDRRFPHPVRLSFRYHHYQRAVCIARPFLKECLP